ncbi:MAG: dTMP kinase [Legionellales bacterium]|nr:dTMP kinase [Legionellales bacterium]
MLNRGHFIVVEGLEGAGKTTALQTLKRVLSDHVSELITTREPGGTRVGEAARHLIKDASSTEPLDPRTELLLLYASRVQLIELVIRPALARGCWVLADRFELSTWAYQGGGRKLPREVIAQLSSFCLNSLQPDLIIFLDIQPEQGLRRVKKRGKFDRIEQESLVFFKDVAEGYHQQIRTMNNVAVIDASKPQAQVQHQVQKAIEAHIQAHHHELDVGKT